MTQAPVDLGRLLAVLRMAIGAGVWVAPGVAVRVLGDRVPRRTSLPFVLRLFGARDFTMGLGYLQGSRPQQHQLLIVGMAVDAADAVAALLAHRRGQLPARLALPFAAAAGGAAATAAVAHRQDRNAQRQADPCG